MSSKFSKVAASKTKQGQTTSYELFGLVGMEGATVIGRPATRRLNYPYTNAMVKKMEKINRQARTTQDKASILNAQSDAAREPFAKFVMTGWSGIIDDEGKEAKFTTENAYNFVHALPDLVFDEMLVFFSNEANFSDALTAEDAKDAAKN